MSNCQWTALCDLLQQVRNLAGHYNCQYNTSTSTWTQTNLFFFRRNCFQGCSGRERGGTPFRQIFWSWNGAPANIVGHRWNANTEAFRQITSFSLGWPSISLFSGPNNCPQTRDLASKISKKNFFRGWHQRTPSMGGSDPVPHPPPARPHAVRGGARPPLLGPRSRKPFPQIKIYHYTFIVS